MKIKQNYLNKKPLHNPEISWSVEDGAVTLKVENKGFYNKLAQLLFKRPKTSFIHLDKMGSFIWPLIDGQKTIAELGQLVDIQFSENAHPLYERLVQYFKTLDSCGFIKWNN